MPVLATSLHRLITKRTWSDQHALRMYAWMGVSCLAATILLVLLTLLVDLLATQESIYFSNPVAQAEVESQAVVGQENAVGQEVAGQDLEHADGERALEATEGLAPQVERFGWLPLWSWLEPLTEKITAFKTTLGALLLLTSLTLLAVLVYVYSRSQARVASSTSARELATWLRSLIHRQTLRLGPSDLTGTRYQSALSHFTTDTENLREVIAEWRWRLVRSWTLLPLFAIAVLAINWKLGLQCLVPAVLAWLFFRQEKRAGTDQAQIAQARAETEVRYLAESLKQTRLVRGYNMEEFELNLFNEHLARMTRQAREGKRLERTSLSLARLISWVSLAIVLLFIALRITSPVAPIPLSIAVVLLIALALFVNELKSGELLLKLRREIEVTGERIYRYLDETPEVGQAVGAKFIQPVSQSIVLESVHYQQLGHHILKGIDLRIPAQSEIGLVSLDPLLTKALAYLLPRFIEPSRGRVLFDGEDLAWGTLESVRAETLYVGAEDPVLSGSILDNILCGEARYNVQDAIEAAKLVHAHSFISQLPQGYETILGEHGEQLDAGQSFRIGLARAALRNPAVLIIEEPSVQLDGDTKSWIDDAYSRLAAGRTMIYLPSRLTTCRRCDQIIFLHEGRVEALGTHQELTKSSELFRHWDYVTFNSFSRRSRRLQNA